MWRHSIRYVFIKNGIFVRMVFIEIAKMFFNLLIKINDIFKVEHPLSSLNS